jgi:MFS family permease
MGTIFIFSFLIPNHYVVIFKKIIVLSVIYTFFENSFLAIQFCITPETFPPEVRNTATGIFTSATTIASSLAPFVAALILENTQDNLVFILVMASALLFTALCCLVVIETKGFDTKTWGTLDYS